MKYFICLEANFDINILSYVFKSDFQNCSKEMQSKKKKKEKKARISEFLLIGCSGFWPTLTTINSYRNQQIQISVSVTINNIVSALHFLRQYLCFKRNWEIGSVFLSGTYWFGNYTVTHLTHFTTYAPHLLAKNRLSVEII